MTLNIASTQRSPIARTPNETTVRRSPETEINTELYSAGWFDGLMGYSPKLPHFKDYWDGYAIGYREYCCSLLGVSIPINEISADKNGIVAIA